MTAGIVRRRLLISLAAIAILTTSLGPPALAHGPNPILGSGTRWDQDQVVGYQWASPGTPPSWAAAEIDAAAADVARTKKSRAATFTRVSSASSRIYYGATVPCSSYGIACMNRTGVPDYFAGMWFRPHNWPFDWGDLKWCQALAEIANGCYDVENVALDEFGHIELLDHHVNYADERDFTDSVVQFAARSRPKEGWSQHDFGRCDVARLQLEYELESSSKPVSTCLNLAAVLTISAPTSVLKGGNGRVTGTLRITTSSTARRLAGDPLSGRTIALQRRPLSSSTWSTIGTMVPTTTAGSYGYTVTVDQTADYRLVFADPVTEGLTGATSGVVRITATTSSCTSISGSSANRRAEYIIPPDGC